MEDKKRGGTKICVDRRNWGVADIGCASSFFLELVGMLIV